MTVNIDKEVYEKSHALGINVSAYCTNALRNVNATLEALLNQKKGFLAPDSFTKEAGVRSPGFEPGSSTWQTSVDWDLFRDFIAKNHTPRATSQIVANAQRFKDCLLTRDFGQIRDLGLGVRRNALSALSGLAKFLGVHDDFKFLVAQHGITWAGKSADDLFIERLNKITNPEEIWMWIRSVKEERPELSCFLDLLAFTGLRLGEGINSYNLIIKLAKTGQLNLYFKAEKLEHFLFKDLFIRKSKKAFFSFVPEALVKAIAEQEKLKSSWGVQQRVRKSDLPLRFSDIREAHATFMNRYLKKEEIDVLHGRVTSSVFMQHYFNPALIGDLQARVFQGINEIQEKIKGGG